MIGEIGRQAGRQVGRQAGRLAGKQIDRSGTTFAFIFEILTRKDPRRQYEN